MELTNLICESFDDYVKGKSEASKQIITELIKSLAKDILTALDTRGEGNLDVIFL